MLGALNLPKMSIVGRDLTASIVVFLVAMPLCMGIAVASGVPPEKGLITGIIGGIVVGTLAGSPLQVSGPAAGLAVVVFELVRDHGMSALGPILILAGIIWIGIYPRPFLQPMEASVKQLLAQVHIRYRAAGSREPGLAISGDGSRQTADGTAIGTENDPQVVS